MKMLRDLFSMIFLDGDGGAAGGSGEPSGGEPAAGSEPAAGGDPGDGGAKTPENGGDKPPKLAKFASQLSPEIREQYQKELSEDYADKHLNDVWSELMEAKGKMSRSVVFPDPENPDPEELKAFMQKMGIPEKPEGYELKADGVDPKVLEQFSGEALKMGLTKSQAQKVVQTLTGMVKQGSSQIQEKLKAAEQSFPERMAEAAGGEKAAESAINLAKKFLIRIGDKNTMQTIRDSGLLYNPAFMKKAAEFEKALGDSPFVDGQGNDGSGAGGNNQNTRGAMGNYSSDWVKMHG